MSEEHAEGAGASAGAHATSHTVVLAVTGLLVGTLLRFVETQLLPLARQRWPRLQLPPFTLSVFLTGALASAVDDVVHERHAHFAAEVLPLVDALDSAQTVDPHVILLVLLPPLIYESASNMNYHVFRRVGASAFLLAFPGVLLQMFLVGAALRYASGYGEGGAPWDWNVALLLGSIVTATDPVAVVATLHALGAPEKLSDVIDGESLLNDGSAMVMFTVWMHNIRQDAAGEPGHSFGSGALVFARLCVGGAALGGACFYAVVTWLRFVENDFRVEVGILLLFVYACFGLAEIVLGVSGVLAVVTFGLLMARRGKYAFSPHATAVAESVMPMLAHLTETLIFFLAGIAAFSALAQRSASVRWWHAFPLYLLLHAVRALTVSLLYPALSRLGYSLSLKEGAIIVFAGLRGAVGLALSLLVVHDAAVRAPDRERVHFHVAGTVALTMLINGTCTSALYDRLRLYPANPYRDVLLQGVVARLEGEVMERIRAALSGRDAPWLYAQADWQVVRLLVPDFSGTRIADDNRLQLPPEAGARVELFTVEVVRRIVGAAPTQEAVVLDEPEGPAGFVLAWLESLEAVGGGGGSGAAGEGGATPGGRHRSLFGGGGAGPDGTPGGRHRSLFGGGSGYLGRRGSADARRRNSRADGADGTASRLGARARSLVEARPGGGAEGGEGADVEGNGGPARRARTHRSSMSTVDPRAAWRAEASVAHARQQRAKSFAIGALPVGARGSRAGTVAPERRSAAAADDEESAVRSFGASAEGAACAADADAGSGVRARSCAPLEPAPDGGATAPPARALGARRASADCAPEHKRDEIVTQLFAVLRRLYFEAYEHKQLDGAALALLVEALSSGEEYLAEHPAAEAGRAFELELDVLLYELPLAEPRWARPLRALPLLGEVAWRHALFQRTYEVTEALAGFVHAHAELARACAGDIRKSAVVDAAVVPVLARAKEELHEHRLRNWSVATLQINLLTARAANEMKRKHVHALAKGGDLTDADVAELASALDSTMYSIDTVRYALFAPARFHAMLRHVVLDLGQEAHDSDAQALARPAPEPAHAESAAMPALARMISGASPQPGRGMAPRSEASSLAEP